jgi:hypothetical protein
MVNIKDTFIINQWLVEIKINKLTWSFCLSIKIIFHSIKIIPMKPLFTNLNPANYHSLVKIMNTLPILLNMLNVILTKLNLLPNKDFYPPFYHILSKPLWMILNNVLSLMFNNQQSDRFNHNLFVH